MNTLYIINKPLKFKAHQFSTFIYIQDVPNKCSEERKWTDKAIFRGLLVPKKLVNTHIGNDKNKKCYENIVIIIST